MEAAPGDKSGCESPEMGRFHLTPGAMFSMDERVDLGLPAEPPSIRTARGSIASLSRPLADDIVWRAKLLVSELVTNVVRHSNPPAKEFRVHLRLTPLRLRIEICNSVPPADRRTRLPPVHPGRSGGLGLLLVEQVADRWGVKGTCAWAEIDLGT
jgi:anti-sigma regulatory factor (Ser/Thr protein kinase)